MDMDMLDIPFHFSKFMYAGHKKIEKNFHFAKLREY